jgi:hypothetical protein
MMLGIVIFGALSDRLVKSNLDENKKHRPEIRLTPYFTLPAGLAIPSGLFIYGWTIQYHVHWIVPMIGVVVFAFGLMGVMVCCCAWSPNLNRTADFYGRCASRTTCWTSILALLPP